MWVLNNTTPFAAERCWVRDKNGAEVWLVAVKGTFAIQPDGSTIIQDEQEPVNIAPKLRGSPENSSLLFDTDLPHKKKATDILVEGHAYAPAGKYAKVLDVGLKVANIKKICRVTGDRIWEKAGIGIALSKPQPFQKMPLIYERAFGGTDLEDKDPKHRGWERRNPIGQGFATREKHLIGKFAPNIEDPASLISHWKQRPRPVGFGPIAGHWSPRVELAGTYNEDWEKTRQPLLPNDFDERFYQCAPQDQQVPGYLKGRELFELYNMTSDGILKFGLPRISIGFTTNFDDGSSEEHRGSLYTVTVKPDYPKVEMVWHTHLACHHKVLKLNSTMIRVKQRIMQSVNESAERLPA